jgi:hypothetical protein
MNVEVSEKPVHPKEISKKEEGTETEQLSFQEIESLMDHDSYRRVKGKIKQQRWVADSADS